MSTTHPRAALALLAAAALAALGGCGPKTGGGAAPPAAALTVQDIMDQKVDPAADAVWAAAGTIETPAGVEDRQPKTDEAWSAVRAQAASVVEGAQLLQTPRAVGADGHGLADQSTPGTRTALQIEADIAADPARFYQFAKRLQTAGEAAGAAAQAKNTDALIAAGADMDAACEACHAAYWYPRTPPLVLPDDKAFGRLGAPSAG